MQDKKIEKMDQEIAKIIQGLNRIGPMRPGGLTRQYHKPAQREGGYWQLSYTHRRRSYSENVREEELERVQAELKEYQQFKDLCAQWVDLALERSRALRDLDRRAMDGARSGPPSK